MARIRNPEAYAAWLARKQMAQTQQQNVASYDQGGVDEQTRQQLMQEMAQRTAYADALAQQQTQTPSDLPVTGADSVSNRLFGGRSIFEGNIFR